MTTLLERFIPEAREYLESAAQGLLKLERDRRGQVRVFPGPALPSAPASGPLHEAVVAEELADVPEEPVEALMESFREASPAADDAANDSDVEGDVVPKPRRSRKSPAGAKTPARRAAGAKAPARRRKAPALA